mgnify:CR=1 FL=1
MERLKGKSVYKGIALGKISVLKKDDYVVKRVKMENSEAEIERVAQAREKAKEQLIYHLEQSKASAFRLVAASETNNLAHHMTL